MSSNKLKDFMHVSNLIENIDNESDDYNAMRAYTMDENWIDFHKSLKNLNAYCVPGKLRDYPVWIWWRPWMSHENIEWEIAYIFHEKNYPNKNSTFEDILKWHIAFEHMHPFGDGNWRVWRHLLAIQCKKAKCLEHMYDYFLTDDFHTMRKKYYNIF